MPDSPFISLADARRPLFVGADVGGTAIKLGLVDDLGRTLAYRSVDTDVPAGPDTAVARIADALERLLADSGAARGDVARVGLAAPGIVDVAAGVIVTPFNLPTFRQYPIRDRLAAACGFSVSFDNDANAAAYGEYWVGSGRDAESLLLITLGTGVGGGMVVGGKTLRGAHGHGGECGHVAIDHRDDARLCPCGQRGHLEGYASATAVVQRVKESLDGGQETSLRAALAGGEPLSPRLIHEHALAGDPFCLTVIDETAAFLGIALASMIHLLDPQRIVLGGAMTFGGGDCVVGRRFLAGVRAEVRHRTPFASLRNTPVEFATLGADAGYLGAAGIAREDALS